jgi:mannose-6-phosphate isomerase-like protein (cupin superfamily)/uncharacterized protein YndB with AHSA1/START domain
MAKPGDVLEVPAIGLRFEFRATAESTGGEYVEVDVIGRPRGFIRAAHVHTGQTERHEVISGAMKVGFGGRTRVLRAGDSIEIPPGTPHTQRPAGDGPGHIRVTVRPAGEIEGFLERLATLEYNRFGFPRPLDAARLVLETGDQGHAARPPLRVQKAIARAVLRFAGTAYEFVDEWDVAAPPEAVFDALADARSYPAWWKPVYIDVEADPGPAAVGKVTRQHFKGRLPYHLRTQTRTVRLERPRLIEGETEGDLRGRGIWTLTPTDAGTHVRFDWRVHADRPLLRALTPVLRPALRWNHNWAIARAREGLEPYAQALARSAVAR